MENLLKKYLITDIGEDARRQYIDAQSVFVERERTRKEASSVSGSMFWRQQSGREYLIRQTASNAQKSLGPRSADTEKTLERFTMRKTTVTERLQALDEALDRHRRMNRALYVGRAPQILVDILNGLGKWGVAEHFTVVGTHALYAYEATAGVRIGAPGALATMDVDLLWDTRRRLQFVEHMQGLGSTMMGLLQKIDPTFRLSDEDRFKAINKSGFEVDIIRREAHEGDDHPLALTPSNDGEEFYAVQAERAGRLLSAPRHTAIVVSSAGDMARMTTIEPAPFVEFKRWMSTLKNRDQMKRDRDALQAEVVQQLMLEYLPHLIPHVTAPVPTQSP